MKKLFSMLGLTLAITSFGQKKVLDHTVYDSWQSIREVVYQPQGKFISYLIAPQEGDAVLVIKDRVNNTDIKIQRGAQAVFSENGQFLVAKIKPLFADTRKAKIDKKKADDMPKDSLVIVNLTNGNMERIASVKSFQLPEHGNNQLVYLKDKKGDINKEGSELVWKNLSTNTTRSFSNIAQYQIQPQGLSLAMYQVKTKTAASKLLLAKVSDTIVNAISNNFYTATSLNWNDQGNTLAYLVESDSTDKALQKNYELAVYTGKEDTAKRVVGRTHQSMPKNYTIGGDKKIKFSKSGTKIEFGVQPLLPAKDTTAPEFERAGLDIWNYKDPSLMSVQLKNLDNDLKATDPIVYNTTNESVVYFGKIKDRSIIHTKEGDGEISFAIQDSSYEIPSQWQGFSLKDIYQINTTTVDSCQVHTTEVDYCIMMRQLKNILSIIPKQRKQLLLQKTLSLVCLMRKMMFLMTLVLMVLQNG
jgi:hypothetical protein